MTADLEDRLTGIAWWVNSMRKVFDSPEAPVWTRHLRPRLEALAGHVDALAQLADEGEDPKAVAAAYERLMAEVTEVSRGSQLFRDDGGRLTRHQSVGVAAPPRSPTSSVGRSTSRPVRTAATVRTPVVANGPIGGDGTGSAAAAFRGRDKGNK